MSADHRPDSVDLTTWAMLALVMHSLADTPWMELVWFAGAAFFFVGSCIESRRERRARAGEPRR